MKKHIPLIVLAVLFVGFIVYSQAQIAGLRTQVSLTKSSLNKTNEGLEATDRLAFALPYEGYAPRRLAFEPNSSKLYLPEFKIRLPYSEQAKSLLYGVRTDELGSSSLEADLTSDNFMPPQEETTLNCSTFLRIKIEDQQSPYNPSEKATTFKLQNGKSLQVYEFTGELEGNDQCKKFYDQIGLNVKDYVAAFKGVESY